MCILIVIKFLSILLEKFKNMIAFNNVMPFTSVNSFTQRMFLHQLKLPFLLDGHFSSGNSIFSKATCCLQLGTSQRNCYDFN